MNFLPTAAAALTVLCLSGCASSDTAATADHPYQEPVYRTGSNIPVREKTPATPEEKASRAAEAQRALEQMQRTGAGRPSNN